MLATTLIVVIVTAAPADVDTVASPPSSDDLRTACVSEADGAACAELLERGLIEDIGARNRRSGGLIMGLGTPAAVLVGAGVGLLMGLAVYVAAGGRVFLFGDRYRDPRSAGANMAANITWASVTALSGLITFIIGVDRYLDGHNELQSALLRARAYRFRPRDGDAAPERQPPLATPEVPPVVMAPAMFVSPKGGEPLPGLGLTLRF